MFQGNHVVMVSVNHGTPSVQNVKSLTYAEMMVTGLYEQYTKDPVTKKEAEDIKEDLLREISGGNE